MYASHYGIDFASISIILFFIFFTLLIIYLRREDRREGYPLEEDPSGRVRTARRLAVHRPCQRPSSCRMAAAA